MKISNIFKLGILFSSFWLLVACAPEDKDSNQQEAIVDERITQHELAQIEELFQYEKDEENSPASLSLRGADTNGELFMNTTGYVAKRDYRSYFILKSKLVPGIGVDYNAELTPSSGDPKLLILTYPGKKVIRYSDNGGTSQDKTFFSLSDMEKTDTHIQVVVYGYRASNYTLKIFKRKIPASKPLASSYVIDNNNTLSFGKSSGNLGRHKGIDYMTKNKNPDVKAVCDGKIETVNTDVSRYSTDFRKYWSGFIIIKHNCGGSNFYGYYGHVKNSESLSKGDTVTKGTKIAEIRDAYKCSGTMIGSECYDNKTDKNDKSTLNTANNHLHFGINASYKSGGWGRGKGMTLDQVLKEGWRDPTRVFGW